MPTKSKSNTSNKSNSSDKSTKSKPKTNSKVVSKEVQWARKAAGYALAAANARAKECK